MSLQTLDISCNKLVETEASTILQAIQANVTGKLWQVDVRYTEITEKLQALIKDTLRQRKAQFARHKRKALQSSGFDEYM